MDKPIFAFDFSCNKPAMTSLINGVYEFYIWPMELDSISIDRFVSLDVNVYNRNLPKIKEKSLNQHELIIEHVNRANDLAILIIKTIKDKIHQNNMSIEDAVVINEGFAFSAKGDAALQLAGYKYILMAHLIEAGINKLYTYSPIQIKKTANCSKRGLGKDAMITAMSNENIDNHYIKILHDDPAYLKKKTSYINCVDDIADSYWCLKTYLNDSCRK